jgi:predicted NUDIX family phosphoesterase
MSALLQEQILVIKRATLFAEHPAWHGLSSEMINPVLQIIAEHQESMPRHAAEVDPTYKQIISYMVFTCDGKLFVMQRKNKANEQRLANKLSIGIGGHMRQKDLQGDSLFDWIHREFDEEVSFEGNLQMHTLGILNDDSNEVGQRHLGIVALLKGDNDQIALQGNELKSGELLSMEECFERFDEFESWSQLVLKELIS